MPKRWNSLARGNSEDIYEECSSIECQKTEEEPEGRLPEPRQNNSEIDSSRKRKNYVRSKADFKSFSSSISLSKRLCRWTIEYFHVVLFCLTISTLVIRGYSATIGPNELSYFDEFREEYDRFAEHFLLPEDFDLADQMPVHRPTADELDDIQNNALFEGDILGIDPNRMFTMFQHDDYDSEIDFGLPFHSALNTATYADKLWHKAKVPYILEEGMSQSQRAAIASAFDEYKGKTCIKFLPKEDHDRDYIYIKRNIGMGCMPSDFSMSIRKHFSRTDRDDYVDIVEENIRPGMMRNFEKYPKKIVDTLEMPYDYGSKATILPRKRDAEIGQRYRLSEIDQRKINKLYDCPVEEKGGKTTTTTPQTLLEVSSTTTIGGITESYGSSSPTIATTTTSEEGEEEEMEEKTTESPTEITTSTGTLSPEPEHFSTVSPPDSSGASATTDPAEPLTSATESAQSGTTEAGQEIIKATTRKGKLMPVKPPSGAGSVVGGGWPGFAKNLITFSILTISRGGKGGVGVESVPWPPPSLVGGWIDSANKTKPARGENKGAGFGNNSGEEAGSMKLEKIQPGGGGGYGRSGTGGIRHRVKASKQTEESFGRLCEDKNAHCGMWEKLGHCEHSPKYMSTYCRKSCHLCNSNGRPKKVDQEEKSALACSDRNIFCGYWARQGECESDSKFMRVFCRLSCGHC